MFFCGDGRFVPLRQFCEMIQHIEAALIGRIGIFYSNFEWIRAHGCCNLVEEAFIGESVLHPPGVLIQDGTQRRRLQAMANGFDVRKFVADRRIANDAAR